MNRIVILATVASIAARKPFDEDGNRLGSLTIGEKVAMLDVALTKYEAECSMGLATSEDLQAALDNVIRAVNACGLVAYREDNRDLFVDDGRHGSQTIRIFEAASFPKVFK